MTIKLINRLTGFGILVFLVGFTLSVYWLEYLKFLMPIGSLMTFSGVFLFFKEMNLSEQFRKEPREDIMTYFWNVLALKIWTFIFVLWMIVMNLGLIAEELQ